MGRISIFTRNFGCQILEKGEGKSCIISLIAAIFALIDRTVHICSSNIKLANRDYINSFNFFQQLKLKSSVFVHDNELPVPSKKKKKTRKDDINSSLESNTNQVVKKSVKVT